LISASFKKTVINYENELVARIEEELGEFEGKRLNDGEPVEQRPRMVVEEDGLYTGEWSTKTGHRHGSGTLILKDGTKFTGTWRKGFLHGHGRIIFSDGDYYEGQFVENMMQGHGKF
jgi:hypothetical protein